MWKIYNIENGLIGCAQLLDRWIIEIIGFTNQKQNWNPLDLYVHITVNDKLLFLFCFVLFCLFVYTVYTYKAAATCCQIRLVLYSLNGVLFLNTLLQIHILYFVDNFIPKFYHFYLNFEVWLASLISIRFLHFDFIRLISNDVFKR